MLKWAYFAKASISGRKGLRGPGWSPVRISLKPTVGSNNQGTSDGSEVYHWLLYCSISSRTPPAMCYATSIVPHNLGIKTYPEFPRLIPAIFPLLPYFSHIFLFFFFRNIFDSIICQVKHSCGLPKSVFWWALSAANAEKKHTCSSVNPWLTT